MRKMLTRIAIMGMVVVAATTGCSSMDTESKQIVSGVLCASARANIASLDAGGAAARGAAKIIVKHSNDQKIVPVAKKVADGNTDEKLTNQLSKWLDSKCN